MAELLGASVRRGLAGGCGFHVGTSAAESAMVRGGDGERQGACEVSTGSGRRRGGVSRCRAGAGEGRQAGRWRGELGGVAVSLLCACLVRKKQLAGMGQHSAGPARWAGQVSGPGRCLLSLFLLFSVFYFLSLFLDLVKILNLI